MKCSLVVKPIFTSTPMKSLVTVMLSGLESQNPCGRNQYFDAKALRKNFVTKSKEKYYIQYIIQNWNPETRVKAK